MARTRWLLIAFVVAGCSATSSGPATTIVQPSSTTLESTTTTQAGDVPPCLAGDVPFSANGVVGTFGTEGGDAGRIASIRWQAHDGCERVVIDFLTGEGAPASALSPGSAELFAVQGIVRVTLPAMVDATAVIDTVLDGDLADRVYVVRDESGGLFVDVHLTGSAEIDARAFSVDSPARSVIDLRPGEGADPVVLASPTVGEQVVVLTPPSGPTEYPIVVTGYARTFEANVVGRLYQGDVSASQADTMAADWIDAWGWFTLTFDGGPPGDVQLFVGEDSPADGTELGVRIGLVMP